MFDLQDYADTHCGKAAPIYGTSNIVTEYDTCAECNALCYKLIDCDPDIATVMVDMDLSVYVGRIIRYLDDQNVSHCAIVESYTCRRETWPVITITIEDCFKTCLECNPPVPPAPEFSIKNRPVAPGRDVPQCSTGSTCNSCSDNCGPCESTSTGDIMDTWLPS